jgi:isochorismate synthase
VSVQAFYSSEPCRTASATDALLESIPAIPAFFFSGPTRTVLAHDEGERIEGSREQSEELLTRVEGVLRSSTSSGPRFVVGAIPFAADHPVRLFCPRHVSEFGRWWIPGVPEACEVRDAASESAACASPPGAEHFLSSVREALGAIQRGELTKVVLARFRDFPLRRAPNTATLLRQLRIQNPHGFTFALALLDSAHAAASAAGAATLIGASPELLVSRRGARVVTSPLAGSAPRSRDALEDRRRAEALLRSPKDLHEHQLVVEQILDQLGTLTRDLGWERTPVVTATASMWHLSTRIEGLLRDASISSLRVALALHPTPAVCGTPAPLAAQWIRRAEAFDRAYFTGTLGYMDASGDGDWIVTIRCAELYRTHARVFAGAGIVESSVAEAELAETEAKMQTMLAVLAQGGTS